MSCWLSVLLLLLVHLLALVLNQWRRRRRIGVSTDRDLVTFVPVKLVALDKIVILVQIFELTIRRCLLFLATRVRSCLLWLLGRKRL